MFVRNLKTGDLAEVLNLATLFDPHKTQIQVRFQAGEEVGDATDIGKTAVVFPSGEKLPDCWVNPHYRISFH